MAQRTIVELTDDLDGGKADVTVTFGLDGSSYEIDLTEKNAGTLRATIGEYVGAARRVSGNSRTGASRSGKRGGASGGRAKSETAAIRVWAAANGHTVSDRGRVPASVQAAYAAAQS